MSPERLKGGSVARYFLIKNLLGSTVGNSSVRFQKREGSWKKKALKDSKRGLLEEKKKTCQRSRKGSLKKFGKIGGEKIILLKRG